MKLVGLGSNLSVAPWNAPIEACRAALGRFSEAGMRITGCSRWYRSAPIPASDQPWFVNGVARIETELAPQAALDALLGIETAMGRRRAERWGPRVIDLDLLAWDDLVTGDPDDESRLVLPHPRLHERAFVVRPLAEIAPDWRHPRLRKGVGQLLAELPPDQPTSPVDEE